MPEQAIETFSGKVDDISALQRGVTRSRVCALNLARSPRLVKFGRTADRGSSLRRPRSAAGRRSSYYWGFGLRRQS